VNNAAWQNAQRDAMVSNTGPAGNAVNGQRSPLLLVLKAQPVDRTTALPGGRDSP
jgi:hypothetical protein